MYSKSAFIDVMNLLFQKPLFQWVKADNDSVDVLVVGEDEYCEAFIDLCLQTGQMLGHELNIQAITSKVSDFQGKYLVSRPSLQKFVAVNDNKRENSLANLRFIEIDHLFSNDMSFLETLNIKPHNCYTFVSLSDKTNRDLIGDLAEISSFVVYRGNIKYEENDKRVYNLLSNQVIDPELFRLALNTHLVWAEFAGKDRKTAELEFCNSTDEYYQESSLAFAVSIPYKLSSLKLSMSDISKAAEYLNTHVTDGETICSFVLLEHRRWMLYTICNSWNCMEDEQGNIDYSYCVLNGTTKDDTRKRHLCLCSCSDKLVLTGWSKEQWDNPGNHDAALDSLDEASVNYHRQLNEYSLQFDASTIEQQKSLITIRKALSGDKNCLREFNHFVLCIKNIIDKSEQYARHYLSYKNNLTVRVKTAESLTAENKRIILDNLGEINRLLFPVVQRNLYVDLKEKDAAFLRGLPFILTYRIPERMAIALRCNSDTKGSGEATLSNIAAPLIVYPKYLYYFYVVTDFTDHSKLFRKMESVCRFYKTRNVRFSLSFVIAFAIKDESLFIDYTRKCSELKTKYGIGYSTVIREIDEYSVAKAIAEYIHKNDICLFDGTNPLFSSNRINSEFLDALIQKVPYFEFDVQSMRFVNKLECDYLDFVRTDLCKLQVRELFSLTNGTDEPAYMDYANEYMSLWKLYTGERMSKSFGYGIRLWDTMCKILGGKHGSMISVTLTDVQNVRACDQLAFLQELERLNVICNLTKVKANPLTMTFSYAMPKYEKLFDKAGDMLEIYVYYSSYGTGYFDDIMNGYKIYWHQNMISNEFDCILTKGLKTIIVECKARSSIEDTFIYKIDSIANHLGGQTKKVLVTTSVQGEGGLTERAKQLNVHLIQGEKDIRNVGEKLVQIMKT